MFFSLSAYNFWMFMPIVGPHLGALIGSFLYDLFVGFHWPPDDEEMTSEAKNSPTIIPFSAETKNHSQ